MKLNYRSLLAAVITASLALPGAAMADKRGHGNGHGNGGHGDRHYSHKSGRHHSYGDGGHYYRGHRGGHHGGHYNNYYYRNDDDDGEKLLIGLVVGGVLGYALNGAQHNNADYGAQRNAYPANDTYRYSDSSCLQEREYTTTVRVGGKNVEAYGTACLQPDGSWKRGPAEVESY